MGGHLQSLTSWRKEPGLGTVVPNCSDASKGASAEFSPNQHGSQKLDPAFPLPKKGNRKKMSLHMRGLVGFHHVNLRMPTDWNINLYRNLTMRKP